MTDKTNKTQKIVLWLGYGLLILLGLYLSFKMACAVSVSNSDDVIPWVIFDGIQHHGLSWMKTFITSQANWLFNLEPIYYLEFWLFGPHLYLLTLTGWLFFIFTLPVLSLIARELNTRYTPWILPLFFLFSGSYAYQSIYIACPSSHNASFFWGVLMIWLWLRWLKLKVGSWTLGLIFLIECINMISDPWFEGAFAIPLLCLSLVLLKYSPRGSYLRKQAIVILALTGAGFIAKYLLCFGPLNFLEISQSPPVAPGLMLMNLKWVLLHLGHFFYLFPFGFRATSHFFMMGGFLSVALLIIFLSALSILFWKSNLKIQPETLGKTATGFFLSFSILSIGLMSLFFILTIGEWYHQTGSFLQLGRYLINIFFLMPMGVVIVLEKQKAVLWDRFKILKIFVVVLSAVWLLSSLLSMRYLIQQENIGWSIRVSNEDMTHVGVIHDWMNFLEHHDLNYGYGDYFGADANTVSLLSEQEGGHLILRPIQFDPFSSRPVLDSYRGWMSPTWYQPEDIPPGQKEFFIVINQYDDLTCRDNLNLCTLGVIETLGQPIRRLETYMTPSFLPDFPKAQLGDRPALKTEILVFDHPIYGWLMMRPLTINLGEVITPNSPSVMPAWKGFEMPTPDGTWSNGKEANLYLQLKNWQFLIHNNLSEVKFKIKTLAWLSRDNPSQTVQVWIDGQYFATWQYDLVTGGTASSTRVINISKSFIIQHQGFLNINFKIAHPVLWTHAKFQTPLGLGILLESFKLC